MKVSSCDEPLSSYQRLDLFIKVLRVLCPNLTDASLISFRTGREKRVVLTFKPVLEDKNNHLPVRPGQEKKGKLTNC